MHPGNHVHIISAGEKIHTAFPAMLRHLPGISRTYVIADGETYGTSPNPVVEKERAATRHTVEAVKELSLSLSIPFARETVFAPVFLSARSVLTKIRRENRKARFTLDLSGGPKEMCMALFSLAPWLGGEVWTSFDGKIPQRVPVPDRDIRAMMANVNYQTILAVLLRNRPVPLNSPDFPFVARQYLFSQVWPLYVRQRVRKPDPSKPVPQYKRGRKPANNLSQQTFSTFMAQLRNAGLIEEGQDSGNRKEKMYRISSEGETAFRFFAEPAANSIISQMLEVV
ncbi:MAG: hypothetical protein PHW93_06830 [Candidatus Methanomethylophilaceae archaeon]|nr:hypothetical protein [Candidatus Methanomethylophilaceae archaeon]